MVRSGLDGTKRGREAASVDSAGASIGCIGLIAFAETLNLGLQKHSAYIVIALAILFWFILSAAFWLMRKRHLLHQIKR